MKKLLSLLALTVLAAPASAVVVTFDGFAAGALLSGANTVSPDFTISGSNGNTVRAGVGPNGTSAALQDETRSGYRVDFNIAGVSAVSVDIGDFNSDSENIYLRAYDSGNNLLDTALGFLPAAQTTYTTLSVAAGGNISYLLLGGDIGSASSINSVYFDNLNYTARQGGSVPDGGATLLLLGAALVGLAGFKRRMARS